MKNKKIRPVIIKDYNPDWNNIFDELRNVLHLKLKDQDITIEHVGSTSIKGCSAKPIIDIIVVIESRSNFDIILKLLDELGYIYQGDLGIKGRDAFRCKNENVPFTNPPKRWMDQHLYVCTKNNLELKRELMFRDYLRNHPKLINEYSILKEELAGKFKYDREQYTQSKTHFVEDILKKAKMER